jgi:spermidine/putrescine transport system substrate-binding protein
VTEEFELSGIDPSLVAETIERQMTRRELLRYAGAGAGALGLGALLAACGTGGNTGTGSGGGGGGSNAVGSAGWWSKQKLHHQVNFANWPYYIDVQHGKHPTLEQFTKKTGIKVTYSEVIQDNTSFFQKIKPALQAGQPTGYDIVVLTNNSPVFSQIIQAGWVIPIDHSRMPNFDKYASKLVTNPSYDPGNKYSMAWQSGYTALAYNTKFIKEDITSIESLFDPKYKGKIGMMSDPQELGSAGLLALGKDPAHSTPAEWQQAANKLQAQRDLVRSYYDQSYIQALKNEDTWISMCWSGDIFQANLSGFKDLKMVIPQEGAMLWTDNMMIPKGAENPLDAMTIMDYVYQPKVQALIEDYNNYVCPVPAAKSIIASQLKDPTVANSPTVFPNSQIQSLSRLYYQYKNNEDLLKWNNLFLPIVQG